MNRNRLSAALLIGLIALIPGCSRPAYDIVIGGGEVVNGTGGEPFRADVAIKGGRIVRLGKIGRYRTERFIDAKDKLVVPGSIDVHTHAENVRREELRPALNYLTQGVTTLVTGNCGGGTYEVADFFSSLEETGVGANIVHLVGHGEVRSAVMGSADRAPTPEEMEKMKILVAEAMREGAAGLSSGLFYAPGSFARTEEVIDLCRVVGQAGGFYATHIRDESDYTIGLEAAVEEAVTIGEKAGIPVQISHIKALGRSVWGKAPEICGIIEGARSRGVKVFADQYPYTASSTSLVAAVVPRWAQADGNLRERLEDPSLLPGIKGEIETNVLRRCGAENLVISSFSQRKDLEGLSLQEISREMGKSVADTVIELVLAGGPGVISFNMSDDDVEFFMKRSYVLTGSDGSSQILGEGLPHPRSYGAFPRKMRAYVFDKEVLSLGQAVRAATGLPAEVLGFKDRGLLKEGYIADVVVFDPELLQDEATYQSPHRYSRGILWVMIGGELVIEKGEFNGRRAGKPLRFPDYR